MYPWQGPQSTVGHEELVLGHDPQPHWIACHSVLLAVGGAYTLIFVFYSLGRVLVEEIIGTVTHIKDYN